jgi:hypothetical protein
MWFFNFLSPNLKINKYIDLRDGGKNDVTPCSYFLIGCRSGQAKKKGQMRRPNVNCIIKSCNFVLQILSFIENCSVTSFFPINNCLCDLIGCESFRRYQSKCSEMTYE